MALYALTILVFATTRSNAAVSALVMSFLIPTILLSAVAGVLVDRLDVRWALIVPNADPDAAHAGPCARRRATSRCSWSSTSGISLTTVVLTPAEASMIPRVVSKSQLETAMGIFNLTLQASFAVGFAFLGPLIVSDRGPVVRARRSSSRSMPRRRSRRWACRAAPPVRREPGAARRALHEPIVQLREGSAARSAAIGRSAGRSPSRGSGIARRGDRRARAEPCRVARTRSRTT